MDTATPPLSSSLMQEKFNAESPFGNMCDSFDF